MDVSSTEIIAHRGCAFDAPENSIVAFEEAISQGAQRLELDVQLTSDGHVVVAHDETTERVGDRIVTVAESTLQALRSVRLSSGAVIPTLHEVCEAATRGAVALNVEIKGASPGLPRATLAVLAQHALPRATLISSFKKGQLKRVREAGFRGRLGLLVGSRSYALKQRLYEAWPFSALYGLGCTDLVIHHRLVHPLLRANLRRRAFGLVLWTAMEDEEGPVAERKVLLQRALAHRPQGIIVARVAEAVNQVSGVGFQVSGATHTRARIEPDTRHPTPET